MPAFDDPADAQARDAVARLFPGRAVVRLPTLEFAKADGNIHRVTQQQPIAGAAVGVDLAHAHRIPR